MKLLPGRRQLGAVALAALSIISIGGISAQPASAASNNCSQLTMNVNISGVTPPTWSTGSQRQKAGFGNIGMYPTSGFCGTTLKFNQFSVRQARVQFYNRSGSTCLSTTAGTGSPTSLAASMILATSVNDQACFAFQGTATLPSNPGGPVNNTQSANFVY
jgi:hypothetical protein